MQIKYLAISAFAVLAATPACAQSVFDGTWKVDLDSAQLPTKPFSRLLQAGRYTCDSCKPTYTVAADGAFHPVADHPYFDEAAVKVVDPQTVTITYRKGGKLVETLTDTVSADGNTVTFTDEDVSAVNGVPVKFDGTEMRVTKGPAGSHAISGSWRNGKVASVSDAALTMTIATQGEQLTMTTPTAQTYTATFGGPSVTIVGDPGGTLAAVAKTGPRTFQETDTRAGKVVSVMTVVVAADGKSEAITSENKLQGTTAHFVAYKQ